ncbi:RNA polymerase sigma factor [Apibacter raozihei]|uniref:RNA polymerase sigma factor n=1 Tax=Apibacter TaxID=1778601 RepID=UPI001E2FA0A3|nr:MULTISPECIES: RNA polymerase sigma factor [Apibacter]
MTPALNMKNKSGSRVEDIFNEHHSRLKSFIGKRVKNSEDVQDILQDVFYQLIKTMQNDLNPIEQMTAWLYRVTRNIIINKGKKKKEEELPVYKNDDTDILTDFSEIIFNKSNRVSTPETEYLRTLIWEELEKSLSELPGEQREIFELMELEGLSAKDISLTLNIPVNTILSRKHYAVLHLRKKMIALYKELLTE